VIRKSIGQKKLIIMGMGILRTGPNAVRVYGGECKDMYFITTNKALVKVNKKIN